VIVLHACAHNPTGVDPTHEQWEAIAKLVKDKRLFPLFDSAYQGFASGNPDQDAWAIRRFEQLNIEFVTAQSFAKNFGLYDERAGLMSVVLADAAPLENVRSHLALLVRGNYSTPPAHGARVVSRVLNNETLRGRWIEHVEEMSSRICKSRAELKQQIEALATPGNWDHITNQIGMFSYTGLSGKQIASNNETSLISILTRFDCDLNCRETMRSLGKQVPRVSAEIRTYQHCRYQLSQRSVHCSCYRSRRSQRSMKRFAVQTLIDCGQCYGQLILCNATPGSFCFSKSAFLSN
jgi:hypothetical protein